MSSPKSDADIAEADGYLSCDEIFANLNGSTSAFVANLSEGEAHRMLQCLQTGSCGRLQIGDNEFALDNGFDDEIVNLHKVEINENGDYVFKDFAILTEGRRNGDWYSRDFLKSMVHYIGGAPLSEMPVNWVARHTDHPLERIGDVANLRYDEPAGRKPGLYGDYIIFNDEKLPAATTAISLLKRDMQRKRVNLPTSTRIIAQRARGAEHGSYLVPGTGKLVHVALVEKPADPNAGVYLNTTAPITAANNDSGSTGTWTSTSTPNEDTTTENEESEGEIQMAKKEEEVKSPDQTAEALDNDKKTEEVTEPVTTEVNNAKEDVVEAPKTITIAEEDLQAVVDKLVQDQLDNERTAMEQRIFDEMKSRADRQSLISAIQTIDNEVDMEFVESLDNSQLEKLYGMLGKYQDQVSTMDEKLTQLENAGVAYQGYEKGTYAGAKPKANSGKIDTAVSEFYPIKKELSTAAEQLIAALQGAGRTQPAGGATQ